MIKHIFFDLDGTLLPLDPDQFMQIYLKEIAAKFNSWGYDGAACAKAVMKATGAMIANDGSQTNDRAFWSAFERLTGIKQEDVGDGLEAFYDGEFHKVKACVQQSEAAMEAVRVLKGKGYPLYLTTNPMFPRRGVLSRLEWAGLEPNDFRLITDYTSCRYCKPNPAFFTDAVARFGLDPCEILVVGNDAHEDIGAARAAGIDGYLVTDCALGDVTASGAAYVGDMGSFLEFVQRLPSLSVSER